MNSERSQTLVRLIAVALCTLALVWVERHQAHVKPSVVAPTGKAAAGKTAS